MQRMFLACPQLEVAKLRLLAIERCFFLTFEIDFLSNVLTHNNLGYTLHDTDIRFRLRMDCNSLNIYGCEKRLERKL